MRELQGIEEVSAAVGEDLGTSDWHTVTQEQIDLFAEATGDHQWIHVDPERAAAGPYNGTIAHGYLTLSLIPVLVATTFRVQGLAMAVNYGLNRVRFPEAVPSGSRIRGTCQLVEVDQQGNHAQAVVRVTIEREGGTRPVCVADTVVHYIAESVTSVDAEEEP